MHFYGWKKGLKTGMYYLRTRPAVDAIKFTVDTVSLKKEQEAELRLKNGSNVALSVTESVTESDADAIARYEAAKFACSIENREACEMCSG